MNEWEFTAKVTSWLDALIAADRNLPFRESATEQTTTGSAQRRDLTLYSKDGRAVLTGELKMPDKRDGATPYNTAVVEDARTKARRAGVKFFITWNVNECVLWETDPAQERIGRPDYKNWRVLRNPVQKSTQVEREDIKSEVKIWLATFLRDIAAALRGEAVIKRKPLDEKFIDAFEAAMVHPVALTIEALHTQYKHAASRRVIDGWMRSDLGFTISDESDAIRANLDSAAKHACYALATRLIFHEALLRRYGVKLPRLDAPAHIDAPDTLRLHFQGFFEEAKRVTGDYETVFGVTALEVGTRIPFYHEGVVPFWRTFVDEIHEFNFTEIPYDVIGPLFERLIGPEERHKFGQYYTRAEVVDLMLSFAIRTGYETVMDPACGGGTFLVRAYARKRELDGGRGHAGRLEDLYGVDLSAYAVNLTTINLATRDLIGDENYPRIARSDFFDVDPAGALMRLPKPLTSAGLGTGQQREIHIPPLDAVVGNPPYVQQEDIERKDEYARLIASQPGGPRLSKRADLHIYFWAHSTRFLKDGGYLCLLTSSQWLDADYGFGLQHWLLHNYEVVAVLESVDEPWFVGARVVTTATILRRRRDEAAREANVVRFVQLRLPIAQLLAHGPTTADAVLAADAFRDELLALTTDTTNGRYRARLVPQNALLTEGLQMGRLLAGRNDTAERYAGKWGRYLRAPDLWFALMQRAGDRFTPLAQLAQIRFGVKSGKDEFFLPKDITADALNRKPDAREFQLTYGAPRAEVAAGQVRIVACGKNLSEARPLEAEYLEPILHGPKEFGSLHVAPGSDTLHLLFLAPTHDENRGRFARAYIAWGESRNYNGGDTCRNRVTETRDWYDLTGQQAPPIIWIKGSQYQHVVPINEAEYLVNSRLYEVVPEVYTDDIALWGGILNSTLTLLSGYMYGRPTGNEGLQEQMVSDVAIMLVADPRQGTPKARKRVATAFGRMRDRPQQRFLSERAFQETAYRNKGWESKLGTLSNECELDQPDRKELDDAVLELLGLTDRREREQLRTELYDYLRTFFIQTRRKEERANENKKKASGKKRITPQTLAPEILNVLREQHPALVRGYDDLVNTSEPYDTYDLITPGEPFREHDAFNGYVVNFRKNKKLVRQIKTRHEAQQNLVHHLARHNVQNLMRFPLDEQACKRLLSQHSKLMRERLETLETLIRERTDDLTLQQKTLEIVRGSLLV